MRKTSLVWLLTFVVIAALSLSAAAAPVTIQVLKPGDKVGYQEELDFANEYMADHPDVKVEVINVGWGDAYQKIMSGVAAGNAPDIMYIGSRWVPTLVSMNALTPLKWMTEEKLNQYHDGLHDTVTFNGDIYAIPRAFSTKALYYRTDLIDTPPKTWDELIEVAKKVQAENPGMYGFAVAGAKHVSTTSQFFNYVFQNGGQVFDDDGNVVLNSPEAVAALQFYVDLYRKHKIVPNPIEYNREELPNLFKNGTIAMYVCGPWGKAISGLEPDNPDKPYATAPLPAGTKMATILVSDSYVISKSSKYPKVAWDYLNYWTSLQNQKRYDLGHGLVPIMKAETTMPEFTDDPFFRTYVDMAEYGVAQPKPLAWEPFQDIVTDAIQKALLGEATPQAALDEAVQRIKDENLQPR